MKYMNLQFEPVHYNIPVYVGHRLYCTNINGLKYAKSSDLIVWDANMEQYIIMNHEFFKLFGISKVIDLDVLEKDKKIYIDKVLSRFIQKYVNYSKIDNNFVLVDDLIYMSRKKLESEQPMFLRYFDEKYPDKRDVIAGVERCLRMYINNELDNQWLKKLPDGYEKKYEIARKAYELLKIYGYTKKSGFIDAWLFSTKLMKLPGSRIV